MTNRRHPLDLCREWFRWLWSGRHQKRTLPAHRCPGDDIEKMPHRASDGTLVTSFRSRNKKSSLLSWRSGGVSCNEREHDEAALVGSPSRVRGAHSGRERPLEQGGAGSQRQGGVIGRSRPLAAGGGEVDLRAEHLRSEASRVRGLPAGTGSRRRPLPSQSLWRLLARIPSLRLRFARNPTSPRKRGEVVQAARRLPQQRSRGASALPYRCGLRRPAASA